MLNLHYYPNTLSIVPHMVLEETHLPYKLVLVDRRRPRNKTYLKLNPEGKVPTVTDGRQVITETMAILMTIADQSGKLAPKLGTKRRADYYRWSAFVGDTVKEAVFRFSRIGREEKNAKTRKQKQAVAREQLDALWHTIDRHLAGGGPYLLGKSASTPDFHLHLMELWDPDPKRLARQFRNVGKHMARMASRPAVKRVVTRHARERAELQAAA